MGSFVPAAYASIGLVDSVFTRVGASDDLASGQSTFMVEMSEVAEILENATSKSLIILDEIGRGTSTFDGMSIAKAVIEYIADAKKIGAKFEDVQEFIENEDGVMVPADSENDGEDGGEDADGGYGMAANGTVEQTDEADTYDPFNQ
jgi:hypothetical protein